MRVSTRTGDAESEGLALRAVRGAGAQVIPCIVQGREGRFGERRLYNMSINSRY